MTDLESLIRQYVKLNRPTSRGFEPCVCQACNDYKERGAFNFSDGITYNCFNCGTTFGIKHGHASKNALSVLEAFGIPIDTVKLLLGKEKLESQGKVIQGVGPIQAKVVAQPTIELPKASFRVGVTYANETASAWLEVADAYLKHRGFNSSEVEAYISLDRAYESRLILPVYDQSGERLVYFQARSMDDSEPRFKNPSTGKEHAIFNEAALHQQHPVIYVTEGIFDCLSCGNGYGPAIAPLGSSINEQVLFKLRRASLRGRKLVFVIDKNKNGAKMAHLALSEGWSIVFMPDNISDANKCRTTLGKLFLSSWLANNQLVGLEAQLSIKMKCK